MLCFSSKLLLQSQSNLWAKSTFRRLLRIYPFSRLREQAQYNVAYIYMTTGNNQQAIEEFETVINRYPGTEWAARAQYNIGDAHYNTGKYELAVRLTNRCSIDIHVVRTLYRQSMVFNMLNYHRAKWIVHPLF